MNWTVPAVTGLLLLGTAASAETQVTATMRIPDRDRPQPAQGTTRQLVCRGAPDLQIAREADPNPQDQRYVTMAIRYRRSTQVAGDDWRDLPPGTCSWNPYGDARVPAEPGVVRFDVSRDGSTFVPDPRSLELWMKDPAHFWNFYIDDVTHYSGSHGWYRVPFRAHDDERQRPPKSHAGLAERTQLRCRGGAGLAFSRTGRLEPNVVGMVLTYRRSPAEPGPLGKGLEPGTCAWRNRKDLKPEPGRVAFRTAGNAQLKQIQSGSAVDRSTTAAERWPDAQTIPVYLRDPRHYWTFTVQMSDRDSALRHAAWKPSPEDVAVGPLTPTTPTTTTTTATPPPTTTAAADTSTPPAPMPTGGAGSAAAPTSPTPGTGVIGSYRPGAGTTLSSPTGTSGTIGEQYTPGAGTETATDLSSLFDIRSVQATAGLEGVAIRFEAAPNLTPAVLVHTAPPAGEQGALRFDGQPVRLVVQGTPTGGTLWRYSAASTTPLTRGTQYWFLLDAPASGNSRHNQSTGQFRTLTQRIKLGVSEIQIVSDSDTESDGDLWFRVVSCPRVLDADIVGAMQQPVQWSEGRHRVGRELVSDPARSAPDRLRVFITGVDDDDWLLSPYGASHPFWVYFYCSENNAGELEPREGSKAEWNAAVLDLDLTQYVGATATQTFVRRSQPLRDGSKLAFEVRGYIQVTRE